MFTSALFADDFSIAKLCMFFLVVTKKTDSISFSDQRYINRVSLTKTEQCVKVILSSAVNSVLLIVSFHSHRRVTRRETSTLWYSEKSKIREYLELTDS